MQQLATGPKIWFRWWDFTKSSPQQFTQKEADEDNTDPVTVQETENRIIWEKKITIIGGPFNGKAWYAQ